MQLQQDCCSESVKWLWFRDLPPMSPLPHCTLSLCTNFHHQESTLLPYVCPTCLCTLCIFYIITKYDFFLNFQNQEQKETDGFKCTSSAHNRAKRNYFKWFWSAVMWQNILLRHILTTKEMAKKSQQILIIFLLVKIRWQCTSDTIINEL